MRTALYNGGDWWQADATTRFGPSTRRMRPGKARKVAIIAIARKLLVSPTSLVKNDSLYELVTSQDNIIH